MRARGLHVVGDLVLAHHRRMVDARRQLASEAESLRTSRDAPSHAAELAELAESATTPDLDRARIVARFEELAPASATDGLRSDDPYTRVAACWRALLRDQALGTAPPHDGLRLLLLVNLASMQELELLMILTELDPCATVRGAASTLLWRVARDRDSVVDLLLARLASERAPAAVLALLDLEPSLPVERAHGMVRVHFASPSADVRARACRAWLAGGGDVEAVLSSPPHDTDPLRRHGLLAHCAHSDDHARLLVGITGSRDRAEVLAALAGAGRRYPLAAVAQLLDGDDFDAMLCLVEGPYDEADRDRLIELTRVFSVDEPTRLPSQLACCLAEAHRALAPTPVDLERLTRVRALLDDAYARLRAIPGAGALAEYLRSGGILSDLDEFDDVLVAAGEPAYEVAIEIDALEALVSALQGVWSR